ncbi:MAG: ribosome silencing factor [Verrucomicrobiota bacterium]|nr:ribosome silencing factor [Verrucomicrobiota bacterium]
MDKNKELTSELLAKNCYRIIEDLKAENLEIYDMRDVSMLADFYLICTANSTPHLKAIEGHLYKDLKDNLDLLPKTAKADPQSKWLVLDYRSVIIHIFGAETREHYDIEELWEEGIKLEVDEISS